MTDSGWKLRKNSKNQLILLKRCSDNIAKRIGPLDKLSIEGNKVVATAFTKYRCEKREVRIPCIDCDFQGMDILLSI